MKPRFKKAGTEKFRSGLEKAVAAKLPKEYEFEPYSVPYTMKRKYIPDFVYKDRFFIECKGFFRAGDTMKYKSVRDCIDGELIFILSDPKKKVRKGSKMTMGQWCEKEGMAYFTSNTCDKLIEYVKEKQHENSSDT
jgi:hypothetical protein